MVYAEHSTHNRLIPQNLIIRNIVKNIYMLMSCVKGLIAEIMLKINIKYNMIPSIAH